VLGGPLFWPLADAPPLLRFLRDFAPQAPDELGIALSMMLAPPLPFLPFEQLGKPVISLVHFLAELKLATAFISAAGITLEQA
jgi:hypothetical protein